MTARRHLLIGFVVSLNLAAYSARTLYRALA